MIQDLFYFFFFEGKVNRLISNTNKFIFRWFLRKKNIIYTQFCPASGKTTSAQILHSIDKKSFEE